MRCSRKGLVLSSPKGFTLLELSVVVGIIAVLVGTVIVAVNPSRYFAQARNVARRADLERIQGAINQYSIEKNGALPTGVSSTLQIIGTAPSGCNVTCGTASTSQACANIGTTLTPLYIQSMPVDPITGSTAKTYYAVQKLVYSSSTPTGLLIRACSTELGDKVEIKQ